MKPILAIRHVPHEDLGLLADVFQRRGLPVQYADMFASPGMSNHSEGEFTANRFAGLVVMGGPMNVDETDEFPHLAREVEWIRQAIGAGLPVLGICLGSQLVAKALGAKVYANPVKEIGWYTIEMTEQAGNDPLFSLCRSRETVFQWHGDTFDLPPGAVHLARSEACPHQAFRFGETAYGLQFHLELTAEMLDTWFGDAGMRAEAGSLDYIDIDEIRRRTPAALPEMAALGERMFEKFASLCEQDLPQKGV